ncbi:unnamed protein product, partial [Linum tenue]
SRLRYRGDTGFLIDGELIKGIGFDRLAGELIGSVHLYSKSFNENI